MFGSGVRCDAVHVQVGIAFQDGDDLTTQTRARTVTSTCVYSCHARTHTQRAGHSGHTHLVGSQDGGWVTVHFHHEVWPPEPVSNETNQ